MVQGCESRIRWPDFVLVSGLYLQWATRINRGRCDRVFYVMLCQDDQCSTRERTCDIFKVIKFFAGGYFTHYYQTYRAEKAHKSKSQVCQRF